jgi:ABC-type antimicrobial peptide transport system permease subunit
MKTSTLIKQNLKHYWRTNLAVIFGVGIAVAVLAGALLVGDSVRVSLKNLFLARLGNTDYLISSTNFFRDKLTDELKNDEHFSGAFKDICPVITLNGFVTHEKSGNRASQVQVYGVDERFWKFQGQDNRAPEDREILLSEALAKELKSTANDSILLRIEKPTAIPEGSLHGRKDDLGRTIRLTMREALAQNSLGEFSIRPQQGAVRAVFVSLRRLQKDLELTGKVNALLVQDAGFRMQDSEAAEKIALLEKVLKERFALEDLGLKLRVIEAQQAIQLESDSAILNDATIDTARAVASNQRLTIAPVLSYLANAIRIGDREIPYSLVTAIDEKRFAVLTPPNKAQATNAAQTNTATQNPSSQNPPILLNEWAVSDLNAKLGDTVSLNYYLWQEEGRLETKTANFRFAGVLPIAGAAADRDLVPDYPGISDTESLGDWNPPFPVDLKRVRPKDDDYWKKYRTTPKAFLPLAAGQELWQTRFGKATAIRLYAMDAGSGQANQLQALLDSYKRQLRQALDPIQSGFAIFAVKAQGLQASNGATDFGEYFFYFSFFLVVSALMLASLFFKLGIEQRLREIGLLEALGFSAAKIRNLFLVEGAILSSVGSLLGIIGAVFFAWLLMYGLRTFWVGAVGTTSLELHIAPSALIFGAVGGIVAALLCIFWTLRMLKRTSARALLAGSLAASQSSTANGQNANQKLQVANRKPPSANRSRVAAVIFALLGFALLAGALFGRIGQTAGFFGAGTMLMIALLCGQSAWLKNEKKKTIQGRGLGAIFSMGFRNATHRAGRSVLCIALIAAAAFIIVAVDAFKRDKAEDTLDKNSGTGGYALLAESLLPLHYDPATVEGREELNITSDKNFSPEMVTFTRFRVRKGEDASCLNLYQPHSPRIFGASDDFIKSNRFAFQDSLAKTPEEKANPWLLLDKEIAENSANENPQAANGKRQAVIPVIVDANSLTYVLHLKLGDEFLYSQNNAAPIRLRIVAALSDSLFQSEFLMSEKNFLRLFKGEGGYSFFLLDVTPANAATVSVALEERLSDYGFDVTSAGERLASFHRVENTYISTFQTLGALGLLLGTFGLAAVLLRNVLERRKEMALLRAIGYNSNHFALMVIAENLFLLLCGLLTGAACAVLAIAPAFLSRGGHFVSLSLGLLLLAVFVTGLCASVLATFAALRSPLLPALRAE